MYVLRWSSFTGLLLALSTLGAALPAASVSATPIQVYGTWHCSNDACVWGTPRNVAEFDSMNHWIVDRGDGQPSVNLVVLSFVHPLKLLNRPRMRRRSTACRAA